MRYVAAYLLVRLSGKQNVSVEDIKNVLKAGGVDADETKLSKFVADLKASGKTLEELMAEGSSRMSSLGGGSAPASSSAAASAGGAAEPAPAAAAKEESASEEEEEVEMGGFFDD